MPGFELAQDESAKYDGVKFVRGVDRKQTGVWNERFRPTMMRFTLHCRDSRHYRRCHTTPNLTGRVNPEKPLFRYGGDDVTAQIYAPYGSLLGLSPRLLRRLWERMARTCITRSLANKLQRVHYLIRRSAYISKYHLK